MIPRVETTLASPKAPTLGMRWAMDLPSYHRPVLLKEVQDALAVHPKGRYLDATCGQGGHTQAILQGCLPGGHVLSLDLDPQAIADCAQRLEAFRPHFTLVQNSYTRMGEIAADQDFGPADGVLLDLGLSSQQLETSGRGFSFRRDEPLDMRFDPQGPITAADIVNTYQRDDLAKLLRDYGQEPRARAVARALVQERPLTTSAQLARLVSRVARPPRPGLHAATRTFQALRIAVNEELDNVRQGLEQAISLLATGGRLAVISYHSLEDRIAKETLRRESRDCICPPEVPICQCDHKATLKLITRRVVTPTAEERAQNPRSRSARLRVAERLPTRGTLTR